MASIGGTSCTTLNCMKMEELRPRTETWQQFGRDGYGAINGGKGGADFAFRATLFDTEANVRTWITTITQMVGTLVSIVDDFSQTHTSMLITSVTRGEGPGAGFKGVIESGTDKIRGELAISGVKTA